MTEAVEADHRQHLRREAATMGLYVALCLLAVLVARHDSATSTSEGLAVIWGTTLALALAHLFAFRLSGRMFGAGSLSDVDVKAAGAQVGAAAGVGLLASIPVVVLPARIELDAARLVVSLLIALVGYLTAANAGAGRVRSLLYAMLVLGLAMAVAVAKNVLGAH